MESAISLPYLYVYPSEMSSQMKKNLTGLRLWKLIGLLLSYVSKTSFKEHLIWETSAVYKHVLNSSFTCILNHKK